MKTNHASTNRSHPEGGQYALHRGPDGWELTFEGQRATFQPELGAHYVACLLLHPPRKPIHALALAPEARTLSGPTPSATEVIQQRYLGLDEAEAVRNVRRRERELEAVLDDDEEIEPVKAETLRELEAIADFMRQHPWRSRECVQKCARAVSLAIRCLHARLAVAVDAEGKPDPVLQAFARHLNEHLLIPSDGGGIPGRFRLGAALPGWFTYKPPQGVVWEVQSPELECGVRGANDEGRSPKSEVEVQGSRFKVQGSAIPFSAPVEPLSPAPAPPPRTIQGSGFDVQGSTVEGSTFKPQCPPAAVGYLSRFLCVGFALALLATGCAGTRPLRGGKAVTTHKPAGVIEQTLVQGENPSQATKQTQESVKVRTYTVPAGSRIEASTLHAPDAPDAPRSRLHAPAPPRAPSPTSAGPEPSTINSQPSTSFLLAAPMPVVEREETHAAAELGAAQKDTARELGAKLSSLKGIVWVGVGLFVFGLASLVWPPLKVIIGSVTTSGALMLGGVALMVLPSLIVGNELLILGGVAVAVGGWFLAHRHGQLRGLVAAIPPNPGAGTGDQKP